MRLLRTIKLLIALLAVVVSGCTPLGKSNVRDTPPAAHEVGAKHYYGPARPYGGAPLPVISDMSTNTEIVPLQYWASTPPLSPGDRVKIDIEDGKEFSGLYEIDINGTVKLPYVKPVVIAGGDLHQAEKKIRDVLVKARLFKHYHAHVSVRIHEWAPVQVHVSGAVFAPGQVSINVRRPEERVLKQEILSGDFPSERMLTAALRSAGGVRPDAALESIRIVRGGKTLMVSLNGIIEGHATPKIPLMSGDVIVVPGTGRFNRDLVTPSVITPPGIRTFLSNLTVPASANALSAINKEATNLPYGTRMLSAAVSANCVGGAVVSNADRYAVLVRTDPLTGRQEVVERNLHDLMLDPGRDDLNPFMMPNDSLACYDSDVTNLREIARTVMDLLLPLSLLGI